MKGEGADGSVTAKYGTERENKQTKTKKSTARKGAHTHKKKKKRGIAEQS